jgi:hypothetical protein
VRRPSARGRGVTARNYDGRSVINVSSVRRRATAAVSIALFLASSACGQAELPPARSIVGSDEPLASEPTTSMEPGTTVDGSVGEPVDSVSPPTVSPTAPSSVPPPSSSPAPSTSAEPEGGNGGAPDVGEWQDITANLVGLESTCGNVSFVAGDPASDAVLVNIARNGLFSLAADATGWLPIGQGGDPIDHRTQWIEFDPEVPSRYWVSGAYGNGVFRTDDGGVTFARLPGIDHVDRVAVDMTDPERRTLLAGSHEDRALWRSTDGGQTWTDISTAVPAGSGFSSVPVILTTDVYLLGTYRADGAGVFRSEDGGQSWTRVFDDGVIGAPVVTEAYIAWNRESGGLAVSTDGGLTFDGSGPSPGRSSATLVPGPGGTLVTTFEEGVGMTADLGQTWRAVGEPLPFEADGVAYSAARDAFFVWRHTCEFGEEGNPVPPASIVQATVDVAE